MSDPVIEGNPETNNQQEAPVANPLEGYVPKAEFERVMKDMHKFKSEAKENAKKVQESEEQKLREKQDWQKLAELNEQKAKDAEDRATRTQESYLGEKKFSAIKEAALKSGIIPQALEDLEMLDAKGVIVETTSTGKLNILGADSFINNLKALKPHWFGQAPVNVNSNLPGVQGGSKKITESDLIKASEEARKNGDYTPYEKMQKEYLQQQK